MEFRFQTHSAFFLLCFFTRTSRLYQVSAFKPAISSIYQHSNLRLFSARRPTKRGTSDQVRRRPSESQSSKPIPIITDYYENRNEEANEERLQGSIGCQHFGQCPGCVLSNKVGTVDIIQSAKRFFSSTSIRRKRLDVHPDDIVTEKSNDGFYQVIVPSPLTGWRTQAKLAVAPLASAWERGCAFGLYARGTHTVMDISSCEVHHPSINRAVEVLKNATIKANIASYNEQSGDGGLRYVQFQIERISGKVSLTLVWNAEGLKETQPALNRLVKELLRMEPELWYNIWCHCNDGRGNNIFSRNSGRWHLLFGPEFLREPIAVGNVGWLHFSPLVFRQGNMDGFDILALDVAKIVPGGSRVCELYAGIGLLGLTALSYHAKRGEPLIWVRCSDENPANTRCFDKTVRSLPIEISGRDKNRPRGRKNEELTIAEMAEALKSSKRSQYEVKPDKVSYVVKSAKSALLGGEALGASVLIVDPPRKGLEEEVIKELCKAINAKQSYVESKDMLTLDENRVNWTNDVRTLIYVSCGFEAFARDCEQLLRSNAGWMLKSATGYILFPGSDHVETLAVFER